MQRRVAAGVGAWVIGAVSATALSLLAVSVFGRDAASSRGPVLSQEDIARALASATDAPPVAASTPVAPMAPATSPSATGGPDAPAASAPPSPSGATPTPTTASTVTRALPSFAGTVVVRCQGSQVYLESWSPAQGFQVAGTQRGPGRIAAVDFTGPEGQVVKRYACYGGVPVAMNSDDWSHDH
jgi:hypothetical protein